MTGFLPSTREERQKMLADLGFASAEELYADVPDSVLLKTAPDLPPAKAELAAAEFMRELAEKNLCFSTILRGAGAYRHYIPAAVPAITAKEEFLTAYTPYQAEISQGVLQSIFEFQTMICELTGMDAANASHYDGAVAAAEAVAMLKDRKRTKAVVAATVHPDVLATIRTYCFGNGMEILLAPEKEGRTDTEALTRFLDGETACLYLQQPNFYGCFEEAEEIAAAVHAAGAKLILGVNPIALGLMKSPGEWGADVAVGEGQPLGMPLSWGGPYLGFMAVKAPLLRKLPGRIVGQTADGRGRRAYVLTLQAREQHIRREKAGSNVCSNQALCALKASVYLSLMGPAGLAETAEQCLSKAHWFAGQLCRLPGVRLRYPGEYFHEFITELPCPPEKILAALEKEKILGGLPWQGGILWCVTEVCGRSQLEKALTVIREVLEDGTDL
ncbi:MAG: aminomethyl-transferring glycine dehydrogenase subunit GcvPA [Peptococcaceae bacterium]|nr:aminomethyl-transferring glycine dehydrogenase subunit GcvPA [Peptococcaceae bacterium]